ncbi:MAG: MurR/RpiR family transcriptional regulator [Planctomycetota bacterium]|nr:MurR/RpiR family transcriptional regulator [Planctomycetota bacterium]
MGLAGRADLITEIRRRMPGMSAGQTRIGRFILERPGEAKDISLKELCRACETSEPVVFAFCRSLGYDGFRSFKTELAVGLGARSTQAQPGEGLNVADEELHRIEDPAAFLQALSHIYLRSVRETTASLDPERFRKAVDALDAASRVVVLGVGISGNVGFVAQQNFLRTGTPVTWTNDPNLNYTHLAPLKKHDVCLALSQTGTQRDTIDGAAFARERGIRVIAVTSDAQGPLAELAEILLQTGPAPVPSNTHFSIGAQMAVPVLMVTDALAIALGARRRKEMVERSRATAEAMKSRTAVRLRSG